MKKLTEKRRQREKKCTDLLKRKNIKNLGKNKKKRWALMGEKEKYEKAYGKIKTKRRERH